MKKIALSNLISVLLICPCGAALSGCGRDESTSESSSFALSEQGGGENDYHYDPNPHNHPDHGPHGGHLVEFDDGQQVEVTFDKEGELFSVYVAGLEDVESVKMTTTIDGMEAVYEFGKNVTPAGPVFGLKSAELATAALMGKEAAQIQLTITNADGELSGDYELHTH